MSRLLDKEGNAYQQGSFSGQWQPETGVFGSSKDVNLFGQPNIKHDFLGQPVEARDLWGNVIHDSNGDPLYESSSSGNSFSGGGGSSGGSSGDAAAGAAAAGLIILVVIVIGLLIAALVKLSEAFIHTYRNLMQRYPRGMLIFHLVVGMGAVGFITYLAAFDIKLQIACVLLVPGLWGWSWLTGKLPLIFMTINTVIAGLVLWLAASLTRETWQPVWAPLTTGLPIIGNVPVVLAVLPLTLWSWKLGSRKFPIPFFFLKKVVIGAIFCFLLMRVWIDWQPYWEIWMAPLPFLSYYIGWLIFAFPLVSWLWKIGYNRFPVVFTGLNLLVFGGIASLLAFHTTPFWIPVWKHWMSGLPFLGVPILFVGLAPVTFWSWSKISHRWHKVLVIPNLILSGLIIYWILDRTREVWEKVWDVIWGPAPIILDPAFILLTLPLAVWLWRKGRQRWPNVWGIPRSLLWGSMCWWIAERTRFIWHAGWRALTGPQFIDLASLILAIPLFLWVWKWLWRRWGKIMNTIGWALTTFLLGILAWRLLPQSTLLFRALFALFPVTILGWLLLLRRFKRAGCIVSFLAWSIIGLAAWRVPHRFTATMSSIVHWIFEQAALIP